MAGLCHCQYVVWSSLRSPKQAQYTTLSMLGKGTLVGSSIGICAVTDVRGLIWAGWFVMLAIGWKLWRRDTLKMGLSFWSGWIASVTGFWHIGKLVYGPHSTSLIRQLDVAPLRIALGLDEELSTLPTRISLGMGVERTLRQIFNLFFLNKQKDSPMENQASTGGHGLDSLAYLVSDSFENTLL